MIFLDPLMHIEHPHKAGHGQVVGQSKHAQIAILNIYF